MSAYSARMLYVCGVYYEKQRTFAFINKCLSMRFYIRMLRWGTFIGCNKTKH